MGTDHIRGKTSLGAAPGSEAPCAAARRLGGQTRTGARHCTARKAEPPATPGHTLPPGNQTAQNPKRKPMPDRNHPDARGKTATAGGKQGATAGDRLPESPPHLPAATWRRPERQRAMVAAPRSPAAATSGSVQNRAAEPLMPTYRKSVQPGSQKCAVLPPVRAFHQCAGRRPGPCTPPCRRGARPTRRGNLETARAPAGVRCRPSHPSVRRCMLGTRRSPAAATPGSPQRSGALWGGTSGSVQNGAAEPTPRLGFRRQPVPPLADRFGPEPIRD